MSTGDNIDEPQNVSNQGEAEITVLVLDAQLRVRTTVLTVMAPDL